MEKEQVIAFRDNAKINNQQIFIYLDNSLIFYDGLRDAEFLVWDDAIEVVTVFGPIRQYSSENALYRKADTPYEMYTFAYGEIQGMGVYMNYATLRKEVETMVTKGLLDVDKANDMLAKMAPLSRANVNPISRTMKTYSDVDFKNYQEEKSTTEDNA